MNRMDFPHCCGASIVSGFGFVMGQTDDRPDAKEQERLLKQYMTAWGRPVTVIILQKLQYNRWKKRIDDNNFKRVTAWMQGNGGSKFAIFVRHARGEAVQGRFND